METYHSDLNHLSHAEVMVLYDRYVQESSTQLIKEYQLDPKLRNNLYSLFPVMAIEVQCKECGHNELNAKLPNKSNFNKGIFTAKAWCDACDHHVLVDTQTGEIIEDDPKCACSACHDRMVSKAHELVRSMQLDQETALDKRDAKRIRLISNDKTKPRYLPFSEETEKYALMDVVTLMTLMFTRWDESNADSWISPVKSSDGIFPRMEMSNEHPLARAKYNQLIKIDFDITPMDKVVEDAADETNYTFYPYECFYQTNFKNVGGVPLDIKETYKFLMRKFAEGYWYRDWDDQLLNVWIRLGVAECIEYARLKAEEYNFNFESEVKISEIIRELLHEYSVSECFYFISVAYWSAASFAQSNKSHGRKHAENTVPGKILSLAKSSKPRCWDRPKELPRSCFSQMLFDVMLNSNGDAGFYQCPGTTRYKLRVFVFRD